jgi:hypothetical protein
MDETPRIALSFSDGEVRELDPDDAQRVVGQYPEVAREWLKWSRMSGSRGRLILIDETLVERIVRDLDSS